MCVRRSPIHFGIFGCDVELGALESRTSITTSTLRKLSNNERSAFAMCPGYQFISGRNVPTLDNSPLPDFSARRLFDFDALAVVCFRTGSTFGMRDVVRRFGVNGDKNVGIARRNDAMVWACSVL